MNLDKSLTANLARMTHSCRSNILSVSTLAGSGADTAVRKKKKTVETGCIWILIITAAAATDDKHVGDYYYNHNCEKHKVIHSERFSVVEKFEVTNDRELFFHFELFNYKRLNIYY